MLLQGLRSRCLHFTFGFRLVHLGSVSQSSLPQQGSFDQATYNSSCLKVASNFEGKSAVLDPKVQAQLQRMLRVDHAGEFAAGDFWFHSSYFAEILSALYEHTPYSMSFNTAFAVRIYQGQCMVLGKSSDGPLLREMQVAVLVFQILYCNYVDSSDLH
jgi:hypothetical protein